MNTFDTIPRKKQFDNRHKFKRNQSISTISEDILLAILSYTDAYDLISMSMSSKKLQSICNDDILWNSLRVNMLSSQFCSSGISFLSVLVEHKIYPSTNFPHKLNGKDLFFRSVIFFPLDIVKYIPVERICLIINRIIYDLTDFVNDHPGGKEILLEWNRKDALRIFNLANHSSLARRSSEKYIIWSPLMYVGHKGLPQFVLKHLPK